MGLVFTLTVSMKEVGREERLIERERETNATRQKDGWSEGGGDGQETVRVGATALRPTGAQTSLFTSQTFEKCLGVQESSK